MNLYDLFKSEENLQLEKKTLVFLRWIAIIGQLIAIYTVYFIFKFQLPILYCSLIIFFGAITNIYLQLWFKKSELSTLDSTFFLFYDLFQLSFLLFLTGGIKNPFVIFLIVPSIVSSTLLTLRNTFILSFATILFLLTITFYHLPLPHPGDFDFIVPDYYLYAMPTSVVTAIVFLTYFVARFGLESRKRAEALKELELVLAKEQELESIGLQAAAAVHSLGTPLSTITVIAKELKKEIVKNPKYSKDIDLLLSQAKRCSEILKKISQAQIEDDKFVSEVTIQNLLIEITRSFEEISEKKITLNFDKAKKEILMDRSVEITYGIRNFIGNAVKFSKSNVKVSLDSNSKQVKISISDDGPGFPEDVSKKIGQPYIATRSEDLGSKAGLGLGTFIGKTLLERKKASLNFSNSEKEGALVTITWKTSDIII
tara:strand:+ start:10237 stop:11517 length:1281 start_codon:yes stop_codon:yes gene_type:complete